MPAQPRLPPFTAESATAKVRAAEDAWNSRDPERVAGAYTVDSRWRNRSQFINGRAEITRFLTGKWASEHEYRLIKDGDDWRVYDIRIEGVSLVATFRTEFQDEIGSSGFEGLLKSLAKKVDTLKAKG